jgi:hypothetical protein
MIGAPTEANISAGGAALSDVVVTLPADGSMGWPITAVSVGIGAVFVAGVAALLDDVAPAGAADPDEAVATAPVAATVPIVAVVVAVGMTGAAIGGLTDVPMGGWADRCDVPDGGGWTLCRLRLPVLPTRLPGAGG